MPEYYFDGLRPMAVSASLRCLSGPGAPSRTRRSISRRTCDLGSTPMRFREASPRWTRLSCRPPADRYWSPDECGGDAGQGYVYWNLGQQEGKLLCYVSTRGEAKLVWTVESDSGPVLAQAVAMDGDLGRLYALVERDGPAEHQSVASSQPVITN